MEKNRQETREKILTAVAEILTEGYASDQITIRQIAEKANVAIGTINYHFESKEKLLYEVASDLLLDLSDNLLKEALETIHPAEQLRAFLVKTSDFVATYEKAFRVSIAYDLTQGDMSINYYLLPLLKAILGEEKSELELKMLSLQILMPMQAILLNDREFWKFSGKDIFQKDQRDELIDVILKNTLGSSFDS